MLPSSSVSTANSTLIAYADFLFLQVARNDADRYSPSSPLLGRFSLKTYPRSCEVDADLECGLLFSGSCESRPVPVEIGLMLGVGLNPCR